MDTHPVAEDEGYLNLANAATSFNNQAEDESYLQIHGHPQGRQVLPGQDSRTAVQAGLGGADHYNADNQHARPVSPLFGRNSTMTNRNFSRSLADDRFQLKEYSLQQVSSTQANASQTANGSEYDIHHEKERKFILRRFEGVCAEAQKFSLVNQHQSAIDKYLQGLKANQLPYYMVAYAHCMIGNEYMKQKKFEQALVNFENHFTIAEKVKDITMVVNALINVATAKYSLGMFEESRTDLKNALLYSMDASCTFLDDPQGFLGPRKQAQMKIFANLGNSYGAQAKYMEAIKMHTKQLHLAQEWAAIMTEAELASGEVNTADPPSVSVARAAFNLENDYNSLGKYEEADRHREMKLKHFRDAADMNKSVLAHNKLWVNQGMGEFKSSSEVYSGWMLKHQGGDFKGPGKVRWKKKWCSLYQASATSGMVFAYYKDVKAHQRAERYLPLKEVVEVKQFDFDGFKDKAIFPKAFHVSTLCMTTQKRCFYFTCEDQDTCLEWIEVISKAKSDKDKFSSFRRKKGGGFGGANGLDFLRKKHDHENEDDEAAHPTAALKRAPTLKEVRDIDPFTASTSRGNKVLNPMFSDTSLGMMTREVTLSIANGAKLGLNLMKVPGSSTGCAVKNTIPGGQAVQTGKVFAGDIVVSVNGTNIEDKGMNEIGALVKAQDAVTLVLRAGTPSATHQPTHSGQPDPRNEAHEGMARTRLATLNSTTTQDAILRLFGHERLQGTRDLRKPSNDIVRKHCETLETTPNQKWFSKRMQLHFQTEGITVKVRPKKASGNFRTALTHPTESIVSVHQIGATMAVVVDDSSAVSANYKLYAYDCNDEKTASTLVASVSEMSPDLNILPSGSTDGGIVIGRAVTRKMLNDGRTMSGNFDVFDTLINSQAPAAPHQPRGKVLTLGGSNPTEAVSSVDGVVLEDVGPGRMQSTTDGHESLNANDAALMNNIGLLDRRDTAMTLYGDADDTFSETAMMATKPMQRQVTLSRSGGASLGINLMKNPDTGTGCAIKGVVAGGQAARTGSIREGDVVVAINGIDIQNKKLTEINALVVSVTDITLSVQTAVQETNLDAAARTGAQPNPTLHVQTPVHPSMARVMELSRTPSERKSSVVDGVQGLRNSTHVESRVDEGGLDLSPGPRESTTDWDQQTQRRKPKQAGDTYTIPNPDYNAEGSGMGMAPLEPESAYAVAEPANDGAYAPLSGDEEEFDDVVTSGNSVYADAGPQKMESGQVVYAGSSEEEFDDPAEGGDPATRQIYSMPSKDLSAVEQAAFDEEVARLQGQGQEAPMDV